MIPMKNNLKGFTFSEYWLTNLAPRDWSRSMTVRLLYNINVFTDKNKAIKSLRLVPHTNPTQGYKRQNHCVCTIFTQHVGKAKIKCSASLIRCLPMNPPPPYLWLWTDKSCCPLSHDPIPPVFSHLRGIWYAKHPHQRMDGRCVNLPYQSVTHSYPSQIPTAIPLQRKQVTGTWIKQENDSLTFMDKLKQWACSCTT